MATVDAYLNPVDVKDSHVLTKVVERKVDEGSLYDIPFAPLSPTSSRKIRLRVRHTDGAGLAMFKADNADTPIVKASGAATEILMELALISEKDVLMVALASPDPMVANEAAEDAIKKAIRLRKRNINRTKWMAWKAVQDELVIEYPDGTQLAIDYDLDGDDYNSWFSGSHLPTTSVAWSTVASADVIEDTYTWSKLIADDLGVDQSEVTMWCRTSVWRYIQKNAGIKAQLSPSSPRIITPTMEEVIEILGIRGIRIYNGFYYQELSETRSYYLDTGHVLFTAPERVMGDALMEMKDGPVARVVGEDIVVEPNPGAVAEVYINKEQVAKNIRVSTSRLPQMNYPAGFVYADISP
jgi:hypothetical protein